MNPPHRTTHCRHETCRALRPALDRAMLDKGNEIRLDVLDIGEVFPREKHRPEGANARTGLHDVRTANHRDYHTILFYAYPVTGVCAERDIFMTSRASCSGVPGGPQGLMIEYKG